LAKGINNELELEEDTCVGSLFCCENGRGRLKGILTYMPLVIGSDKQTGKQSRAEQSVQLSSYSF
jgi:hypothetical protein